MVWRVFLLEIVLVLIPILFVVEILVPFRIVVEVLIPVIIVDVVLPFIVLGLPLGLETERIEERAGGQLR